MTRGKPPRVLNAVNGVLLVVGAAGVVLMMMHIVANAALRSAGSSALTGTNEYVEYWYMPTVAFLGFIIAMRERSHTEARVLFDWFPRRNQIEIDVFGLVVTAAMCAGFAVYGFQDALHNWEIGLTGGVTGVIIWPVTFLPAITYAVLTVQALIQATVVVRDAVREKTAGKEPSHGGA